MEIICFEEIRWKTRKDINLKEIKHEISTNNNIRKTAGKFGARIVNIRRIEDIQNPKTARNA